MFLMLGMWGLTMTEPRTESGAFNHRSNRDGSWELVCIHCVLTVAVARDEAGLGQVHHGHLCSGTVCIHGLIP
jgi:hypothetical protein